MKKKGKWLAGMLSIGILAAGIMAQAAEPSGEQEYTIGVVVYDPDSAEMDMFMDYYRDYIAAGFPVKFYFSGGTSSPEEENAFIATMKELGADGIISFLGMDVESAVAVCEEEELYYVLGSNTLSEEDFDAVKGNPWFLGTVGPEAESVCQAGRDMAEYFLGKGGSSFLVMTGGACGNQNALHASRARGMLEVFQEQAGLTLREADSAAQAAVEEVVTLTSEDGGLSVTLCPDYTENGAGLANLETAFALGEYDTLMSAFHVSTYLNRIGEKEEEQGSNILVGAIDSFTEANFQIFQERDPFGNCPVDYVQGKYGAMAGPAFALLYNAMSGHPEANTPDGQAVRLYQSFWTAKGEEEYRELYGYTTGIYENAYSCADLMEVICVYNPDTTPEKLKSLAQASDVEAVKARILP